MQGVDYYFTFIIWYSIFTPTPLELPTLAIRTTTAINVARLFVAIKLRIRRVATPISHRLPYPFRVQHGTVSGMSCRDFFSDCKMPAWCAQSIYDIPDRQMARANQCDLLEFPLPLRIVTPVHRQTETTVSSHDMVIEQRSVFPNWNELSWESAKCSWGDLMSTHFVENKR